MINNHVTTTVTLTLVITATLTTLKSLYCLNLRCTVVIKSYVPSTLTLNSVLPQYMHLCLPHTKHINVKDSNLFTSSYQVSKKLHHKNEKVIPVKF